MEITISKIKLTKSILNQMPFMGRLQYYTLRKRVKVLGYLLNCYKNCKKVFLVQHGEKYYLVNGTFSFKHKHAGYIQYILNGKVVKSPLSEQEKEKIDEIEAAFKWLYSEQGGEQIFI